MCMGLYVYHKYNIVRTVYDIQSLNKAKIMIILSILNILLYKNLVHFTC